VEILVTPFSNVVGFVVAEPGGPMTSIADSWIIDVLVDASGKRSRSDSRARVLISDKPVIDQ
jgi:hypothetical protein